MKQVEDQVTRLSKVVSIGHIGKLNLSKHLKEVRELAKYISLGREFQVEEIVRAKALRWEHALYV